MAETEYDILNRDLDLERKQRVDLINKNTALTKQISVLQAKVRETQDTTLLHKELTE